MPRTLTHPEIAEQLQRTGDSAQSLTTPLRLSRAANNLSDAQMLAEDAADICRRKVRSDADTALAQAKALASIALSMAFGGQS